jgi:hypothetical protein
MERLCFVIDAANQAQSRGCVGPYTRCNLLRQPACAHDQDSSRRLFPAACKAQGRP